MKGILIRYRFLITILIINIGVLIISPNIGFNSLQISGANLLEMLSVIPPVFILLGLLDVWVPRETMVKFMGKGSGLLGIAIAFILGSAAAGPLYAAFPVAGVLMKKGSSFFNILIFIGAWSTTKIPLLLFEASSMGWKFTITRLLVDIAGIIMLAYIINALLKEDERAEIYKNADKLAI